MLDKRTKNVVWLCLGFVGVWFFLDGFLTLVEKIDREIVQEGQ